MVLVPKQILVVAYGGSSGDYAPFRDDLSSAGWDLLQSKFEVSNYTYYENMISSAKSRNGDSLGWLEATQGHRQCHQLTECIRLPI